MWDARICACCTVLFFVFFLVFGLFSCTAFYRLWWIKMTISTIHIIRRGLLLHTSWSIWVFISHGLESFFESPLCVNMFLRKHKWLSLSQYAFDTLCSVTRCVSLFPLFFFKFLVFEAAFYANKDVYIEVVMWRRCRDSATVMSRMLVVERPSCHHPALSRLIYPRTTDTFPSLPTSAYPVTDPNPSLTIFTELL